MQSLLRSQASLRLPVLAPAPEALLCCCQRRCLFLPPCYSAATAAAGLQRLPSAQRQPLEVGTAGTGELREMQAQRQAQVKLQAQEQQEESAGQLTELACASPCAHQSL